MSKYLVFGHKNPDTDAIGSAIAMSYYLERLGYEAEPVALGTPNDETQFALDTFNIEAPRVIRTASNEVEHVALVDHNEPQQSVDDIEAVEVDFVVDHHRISGFETAQPLYYRCEPIGCTASVLYKMFQEKGIDIPTSIAGMMLSAVISDTLLFKSPTATKEDQNIAIELAKLAQVDLETYGLELLKSGTNLTDKSDLDILSSDSKNFNMAGYNVRIGQVNTVGFDEVLERKEAILNTMRAEAKVADLDLFILLVTDILDSDSIALVTGEQSRAVEGAFDQLISQDQLTLPGVVSRKKQVIPQLTEAFEALI